METEKEQILLELEPLFEKAKNEHLWFFCNYQGMWFKPDELREQQSKGMFIWGACNWKLRHPDERVRELKDRVSTAENELVKFKRKLFGIERD